MKAKIKSLKVDLSKVKFEDPSKVNDGRNGKILESAMIDQGFQIDQNGTIDIPKLDIEIKTRKADTHSMHTIGTMTYDSILTTKWADSPIKQKIQRQYRVTIYSEDSATGRVVDLSHPAIQKELEQAYEKCRMILQLSNRLLQGTIKGGQYGCLEHKPGKTGNGKSYAFRIPNSGMTKLLNLANLTNNPLFEVQP